MEHVEESKQQRSMQLSVVIFLAVLCSVCVVSARVLQFNKIQLNGQVDGGVDVRRTQPILAQQFRRQEALDDVVAAAAEPA